MKISILTLFPQMFVGPFDYSILKRAQEKNQLTIDFVNIRDFGIGRHKVVDDRPYGGGKGMILRVDVVDKAIENTKHQAPSTKCKEQTVLLDPRGKTFTQRKARELVRLDHLILVCGHYEGVDERVREHLVDETISIGDYILTGGEIPAMVIVDALSRLVPGVLAKEAISKESFSRGRVLEYPQYTRPRVYKKLFVPKVLFSGHHKEISEWKKKKM